MSHPSFFFYCPDYRRLMDSSRLLGSTEVGQGYQQKQCRQWREDICEKQNLLCPKFNDSSPTPSAPAPLTVHTSTTLHFSIVFLSRSYFFVCVSSLCVSVQVYRTPSLIVFSHRSPGMCRHGLIIPPDRCDL